MLFKASVLFLSVVFTESTFAQNVAVTLKDFSNPALLQKMQNNASTLLTELNSAYSANSVPTTISSNACTQDCKDALLAMWETSPFKCTSSQINSSVLRQLRGGYQSRGIPLYFKNADSSDTAKEGVIVFDASGKIDNFYIAIENNSYKSILDSKDSVTDFRRRQIILDFVENFRTAYNRKDIGFLDKVFSNDALIITGKLVKSSPQLADRYYSNLGAERIEYVKQSKQEYMKNLKEKVFKYNKYLNINFDSITVVQHPKFNYFYGVTLKQYWHSTNYSDVGYIFLLIDFRDENNPLIHIRTWQPANGVSRDSVFQLGDFNLKPGK